MWSQILFDEKSFILLVYMNVNCFSFTFTGSYKLIKFVLIQNRSMDILKYQSVVFELILILRFFFFYF